jgi:hypothetical protein
MKLEILNAIDKDNKITFEMTFDWEFAAAIAKVCGVKKISEKDIENFVIMVLEDLSFDDLTELRNEID